MLSSLPVRPVIDEFVFPRSLHEGQRYNVLCTVIKGDAPLEIEWLKDGVPLFVDRSSSKSTPVHLKGVTVSQVTEFSSMLNFASLRSEHAANYTCRATNVAGSFNHTAQMIIQGEHLQFFFRIQKINPKDQTALKCIRPLEIFSKIFYSKFHFEFQRFQLPLRRLKSFRKTAVCQTIFFPLVRQTVASVSRPSYNTRRTSSEEQSLCSANDYLSF